VKEFDDYSPNVLFTSNGVLVYSNRIFTCYDDSGEEKASADLWESFPEFIDEDPTAPSIEWKEGKIAIIASVGRDPYTEYAMVLFDPESMHVVQSGTLSVQNKNCRVQISQHPDRLATAAYKHTDLHSVSMMCWNREFVPSYSKTFVNMLPSDEIGRGTQFELRGLKTSPDERRIFVEFDVFVPVPRSFRKRRYYWLSFEGPSYEEEPGRNHTMSWLMEQDITQLFPLTKSEGRHSAYYRVKSGDLRGRVLPKSQESPADSIAKDVRSAILFQKRPNPDLLAAVTEKDILIVRDAAAIFVADLQFPSESLAPPSGDLWASSDGSWLATTYQVEFDSPEEVVLWKVRPSNSQSPLPRRGATERIKLDPR
jgi:hypothetical protein